MTGLALVVALVGIAIAVLSFRTASAAKGALAARAAEDAKRGEELEAARKAERAARAEAKERREEVAAAKAELERTKKKAFEQQEAAKKDEPEIPDFAQSLQDSMGQSMKIMMYLFPIFPLVSAFMLNFPLAIGIYFLLNNAWTAVQSHLLLNRLEKLLPTGGAAGLPPSAYM